MGDEMMEKKAKSWILQVAKDPDSDDLMLEFPEEVLLALNLKVGDVFDWKVDGTKVILQKINKESPTTVLQELCLARVLDEKM
jgi:hypothetical protein